jgi:undecaprenyl-diphosphatase
MSIIEGIFLGVLQGITEFLPVSSSGHLDVAQELLGLNGVPILFDVFLHLATLCATILFFRRKIGKLLCIFGRWITRRPDPVKETIGKDAGDGLAGTEALGRGTIVAVILATVITGVIGVCTSRFVSDLPLPFIFGGFILTGAVLIASSYAGRKYAGRRDQKRGISWMQAVVIGIAQGIGTLPGISRSGSTIAGGLFCGVDRSDAGEFSFIVAIPAILGAFILELKDIGDVASGIGPAPVIAGCAAAFASGYLALTWLMKIIRKGRLEWFACYLIPIGVLGLLFLK